MSRLRLAVVMCSVATAVVLSSAAPDPGGAGRRPARRRDSRGAHRRHADAEERRRARLGLAGEGD